MAKGAAKKYVPEDKDGNEVDLVTRSGRCRSWKMPEKANNEGKTVAKRRKISPERGADKDDAVVEGREPVIDTTRQGEIDLPAHSSCNKVITSADGKRMNILFEEDNNYVDMEVAGELATDPSEEGDLRDSVVSEDSSESSADLSDSEHEVTMPSQAEMAAGDETPTVETSELDVRDSSSPRCKVKSKKKHHKGKIRKSKSKAAALD